MATMNGTLITVTVDGNAIGHVTSHSIDYSVNTPDASSKDSEGYQEVIAGQRSGTMSFEALVVYEDDTAVDKMGFFDLFNDGLLARTEFELVYGTTDVGDSIITQKAYLTSLSQNAPNEETVTYSGSFQFTGKPVVSTNN